MFLVLLAAFLIVAFVAIALVAGIGVVAILAAIAVGAAMISALAWIGVVLAARRADAARRRSSRSHVLRDIHAVESRLLGKERT